jgi:hypothetical protein
LDNRTMGGFLSGADGTAAPNLSVPTEGHLPVKDHSQPRKLAVSHSKHTEKSFQREPSEFLLKEPKEM